MSRLRSVQVSRPASMLMRALMFLVVWLALTDGNPGDIWVGIISASVAAWVSLRLLPPVPVRPSPAALLVLTGRFLWASLTAGMDVARCALDPRMPIRPGLILHRTALPPGPARDTFRALMCLQPGALPVESEEQDGFLIHCLDTDLPVAQAFVREEALFANALGIEAGHG